MKRLTKAEFDLAIHKGLGRVYFHVKEYGDIDVRDQILNALIYNLVYDNQSEGGRADWLYSIIELTNNEAFYEDEILKNLPNVKSDWDANQLFNLLMQFAKRGSYKAKKALYEKFDSQDFNESWNGGDQIIEVDGINGFLHVAERIGKRFIEDEEAFWEDDFMFTEVKDRFGAEKVIEAINKQIENSEYLRTYFNKITKFEARKSETKEQRVEKFRQEYPLEGMLINLELEESHFPYSLFGRHAIEEDILTTFNLLKSETRKPQLLKLLSVFRGRKLPDLIDNVFNYVFDTDEDLSLAAISALSSSQNEKIHKLALEILNQSNWQRRASGIELLVNNYQSGDNIKIEELLNSVPSISDRDMVHNVVFDLVKLSEKNNSSEMNQILLWIYENSPCMNCRCKSVELLLINKALPEEVLEECMYDGDEEIREIAQKANKF